MIPDSVVAFVCAFAVTVTIAAAWRLWTRSLNYTPTDLTVWHEWPVMMPVWLVSGRISSPVGKTWRRQRTDGKWEFSQDPQTENEFLDDQW